MIDPLIIEAQLAARDKEIKRLTELVESCSARNESDADLIGCLTGEMNELRMAAANYLGGSGGPNVQKLFKRLQAAMSRHGCPNCLGLGFVFDSEESPRRIECPDCEGECSIDDKGYPPSYSSG